MSFCSLKYEDHKNEDCSLTYPNINEKNDYLNQGRYEECESCE